MNKQKVIIASTSQTISNLFADFFSEKGFEIIETDNGADALALVLKTKPDYIIASINLPQIDGYNVSRIVKNTSELSDIPVILCSVENDSVRRFWAEISKCDAFFHINQSDISSLDEVLQKIHEKKASRQISRSLQEAALSEGKTIEAGFHGLLEAKKSETTPQKSDSVEKSEKTNAKEFCENDLLRLSVRAYDREFFELSIIRDAFLKTSDFEFESLFKEISKGILNVVSYDALGIIINSFPIREFYSFGRNLEKRERQDFIDICHADFEAKAISVKKLDWEKTQRKKSTSDFQSENKSIKSSESYPQEPMENIPFTMTVGSGSEAAFHSRTTERLSFLTSVYSSVIEKAISYNRLADAENKIEKAFGRFVPQSVIDDIVSGTTSYASSAGEKRNVAIMMTDIRSFTSISEINEPEKVVEFLNGFFATMGRVIKKHGGIIDKFIGDAIMALFGAPESFEDNAARAAKAAIEMHRAIKDIKIDLKLPKDYEFSIGTGIHYGPVIVGSVGSKDKKEYTVIGDNVNIASRLEGLTKLYGSPIVISEAVKNDLGEDIPTRHLDNVRVKGKSVSIPIYELFPYGKKQDGEFYENYKKALNQYSIGNFTMAMEYLEKAAEINPDDKATKLLMERCIEYKRNRPENWDGAVILTTK